MITTRGGTLANGYQLMHRLHARGFVLIEDAESPYRFVWLHAPDRAVITYCEGDVITETCDSPDELATHLNTLRAYYGTLDETAIALATPS